MLLLFSGRLLTGDGFAQPATRGNTLPSVQMLNRYGLKMAWWNQANIDPRRDTLRYLTADEQIVYAQTTAGTVTAVDMETGRQLWSVQLGRPDAPSYPVTSNNELALVMSSLDLFAIDKWTGNLAWRIRVPGQPTTSPVMDEEQVYVGTLDGSVYAFDLKKIRQAVRDEQVCRIGRISTHQLALQNRRRGADAADSLGERRQLRQRGPFAVFRDQGTRHASNSSWKPMPPSPLP